MIQQTLQKYLKQALTSNHIKFEDEILVERCKNKKHGHFATNIALMLAKPLKTNPRVIADKLVSALENLSEMEKIEVAGAGFINFTLKQEYLHHLLIKAVKKGEDYGKAKNKNIKILLEFVSANPTGPLHIGHARGAAFGIVLANLLKKAGFEVFKEYYVNDAGRQMDILTLSTWLRFLQLHLKSAIDFPTNAYQGKYLIAIAQNLKAQNCLHWSDKKIKKLIDQWQANLERFNLLEPEEQLDELIAFNQSQLQDDWNVIKQKTLKVILDDIKDDLYQFGLNFDCYFSESTLHQSNKVNEVLEQLKKSNYLYQKDGSWVFKSSEFGDSKDRVVVRSNSQLTYFGTDIAYHLDKMKRADLLINIWGADHHGYVSRIKGALQAFGNNADHLEVQLVQFVRLIKNDKIISMSTRSADFVSLRNLREDVGAYLADLGKDFGNDTVRYFFTQKRLDVHMDFDWNLAISKKQDNPIIYFNYAYSRIQSVLELAKGRGIKPSADKLTSLTLEIEKELIINLLLYPGLIEQSAKTRSPHMISYYLLDLVGLFHTYYSNCKFIEKDLSLSSARLYLIKAICMVVKNGLAIFGISPTRKM